MKQIEKKKMRCQTCYHTSAYLLLYVAMACTKYSIDCNTLPPEDFHPATV